LQIDELVEGGTADFAIATETMEHFEDLVMMPCYNWNRAVVTPPGHPLLDVVPLSLKALATYPLVTYVFGLTGGSSLDRAFRSEGITPRVAFTATDAEIIKTYVRMGLGVGIIANRAYHPTQDEDLCNIDASHLFDYSTTRIGFRRGMFLRGFMYEFMQLFAPHLTREVVDTARELKSRKARDALFLDTELPTY
jgi:LysR family cys regulon transcriptional activator